MESKRRGSSTTNDGAGNAETAPTSFCDICWQRPSRYGMTFRTCTDCGVGVHDECYGIVRDDDGKSAFTCWACQAVGTKIKIRGGKSIAVTKRPTACCLCSVDDGMDWPHAMHPVYDKDRLDGRHSIVAGTKDTLAWAHSLCGFFLNSSGTTQGCIYGCIANGDYVGMDDGQHDDDDDISVNSVLAKGDPNDETIHHIVFCQGNDPSIKAWTKALANTQRDLRCYLCGKKDRGTMRVCTQCSANDEVEHAPFRSTHIASLPMGESCCQAVHVGCAMWERKKGSVYPYRRVFFFPGVTEDKDTKSVAKKITCNAFCNTHTQDLKQIPSALKIRHPPHITVQRPLQRVGARDLGEAKSAYKSRSTLDPRAADPRSRLVDTMKRRNARSVPESRGPVAVTAAGATKVHPVATSKPTAKRSVSESRPSLELTTVTAAKAAAKAASLMKSPQKAKKPTANTESAANRTKVNDQRSFLGRGERSPPRKQQKDVAAREIARAPTASKHDKTKELRGTKRMLKPTHLDPTLHSPLRPTRIRGLDRQTSRDRNTEDGESAASPPIARKNRPTDMARTSPCEADVDNQPLMRKRKLDPRPADSDSQQQKDSAVREPETPPSKQQGGGQQGDTNSPSHPDLPEIEEDPGVDNAAPPSVDDDESRNYPPSHSAPQPPEPGQQGESVDPQLIIDEIIEAEQTYHLDQCLKRKKLKWEGAKNFAEIWPSVVETICNRFDYDAERKTDWKSGTYEATVETLWEGRPPAGSLEDGCLLELVEQKKNEANGDRLAV